MVNHLFGRQFRGLFYQVGFAHKEAEDTSRLRVESGGNFAWQLPRTFAWRLCRFLVAKWVHPELMKASENALMGHRVLPLDLPGHLLRELVHLLAEQFSTRPGIGHGAAADAGAQRAPLGLAEIQRKPDQCMSLGP